MTIAWRVTFALLAAIGIASVSSYPRRLPPTGEPILAGAIIGADTLVVIKKACLDCHSEQGRYPWYSYVAPVSFLIKHDVAEGRRHLNLSRWHEYSTLHRERSLSEIANQIKDGGMPLPLYTWIHPAARLSDAERTLVFDWTQDERARLIDESLTRTR